MARSKSPRRKSAKPVEVAVVEEEEEVFPPPAPVVVTLQTAAATAAAVPIAESPPEVDKKWSWYNEQGAGPFQRFLDADDTKSPVPTLRVSLMMLFGFFLSSAVLWLSEDEFFSGTAVPSNATTFDFPVHLDFKDVGCYIQSIGKDVLFNSTGSIPSGMLTGILGQSGSGKTVLCSFLLGRGRRYCSPARGTVLLNGKATRSLESFLDRVGYVPQDDILYSDLTVEETLMFSAQWRLPRELTEDERARIVNDTLVTLDLDHLRTSRIGNIMKRSLSGGERRRVSIGMELVTLPSVLVADEPTTGLDGASAFKIVKTMRQIVDARNGSVSIVAVLHQPSARVFDLLQHLVLMSHGTVVYSGPKLQIIAYLKQFGGFQYLGPNKDPLSRSIPEYILDVLSGEEPSPWGANWTWPVHSAVMKSQFFANDSVEPATVVDTGPLSKPKSLFMQLLTRLGFRDYCENDPGTMCVLLGLQTTSKPVEALLPKPGFRRQVHIWFWTLQKIQWRKGFEVQSVVVFILAITCAFVRSFNNGWSRRPHSNFVLTMCISLLGTFGAIFTDDIAPVQRAAQSGMILAAHELSCLAADLFLGWILCHWFALNYFSFLWLRNSTFCSAPYSFQKHYEFAHILHLVYLVSCGVGKCVCAVSKHDMTTSFVMGIGLLMHFHVFALFSPSKNQATKDGFIFFNRINIAPVVLFFSKWSYVTYASEVLMLWEPDVDSDKVGRKFTLRYFSWDDSNFVRDLTRMFALWVISQIFRFVAFAVANTNGYNSAYDIPLFVIFSLKVIILHLTSLLLMTLIHEIYTSCKKAKHVRL